MCNPFCHGNDWPAHFSGFEWIFYCVVKEEGNEKNKHYRSDYRAAV